jgi:hypothetical protein
MSLTMSAAEKEVRLMRLFDRDMVGSLVTYTVGDDKLRLFALLSHVLMTMYFTTLLSLCLKIIDVKIVSIAAFCQKLRPCDLQFGRTKGSSMSPSEIPNQVWR